MLPADPPQSLQGLAFNGPDGKPMTLADHGRQDGAAQSVGDMVRAVPRRNAGARRAAEEPRAATSFQVVAVNVDTGDDTKPRSSCRKPVGDLGYYRDNTLGTVQRAEEARAGARPAGDPADRWRRLPAGQHERPCCLGKRGRRDADHGGRRVISASEPDARRDNHRSRGRSCGRASRPRHISPAAGRGGISNPTGRHAAPA